MLIKKKCLTCGKIFFAKSYRKNIAKFCCHPCYAKSLIGVAPSVKSKEKMRNTHLLLGTKPPHPGWGKNNIFYGCKHLEKTKLNWSKIRIGPKIEKKCKLCKKKFQVTPSENDRKFCSRKCSDLYYVGKNAHNYKDGRTKLRNLLRQLPEYKEWREFIFTRDNFTCQKCNQEDSGHLHAHHIKMISKILEKNNIKTLKDAEKCKKLWDTNNGICLCNRCHGRIRYHEEEYEEEFLNIIKNNHKQLN